MSRTIDVDGDIGMAAGHRGSGSLSCRPTGNAEARSICLT